MEATRTIPIDIAVERAQMRDVMRALLHSILFHRLFGNVKPNILDILDVTFPAVADQEIERLVNEKVALFWRSIEESTGGAGHVKHGQVIVTFLERRPKKNWFSMGEEEIPWEQWIINASIHTARSERDRQAILTPLPSSLTRILRTILTQSSSEKGRACVPPIVSAGVVSPFPLRIAVRVGGVEAE